MARDPITGRELKGSNVLNRNHYNSYELDEYMLEDAVVFGQ